MYTGFGLLLGYIEHLQIITTCNYSVLANPHALKLATEHTKSSRSPFPSPLSSISVLTFLVTGYRLSTHQLLILLRSQGSTEVKIQVNLTQPSTLFLSCLYHLCTNRAENKYAVNSGGYDKHTVDYMKALRRQIHVKLT